MLVNDKKEIRNESMTHQYFPLWLQIKQFCEVGTVFVTTNLSLSGRGEVGFCNLLQGYRYTLLCLQSETCFILACVKNCIDNLLALVERQGLEGYQKKNYFNRKER